MQISILTQSVLHEFWRLWSVRKWSLHIFLQNGIFLILGKEGWALLSFSWDGAGRGRGRGGCTVLSLIKIKYQIILKIFQCSEETPSSPPGHILNSTNPKCFWYLKLFVNRKNCTSMFVSDAKILCKYWISRFVF